MDLKKIPRINSDGFPTTDVCIVEQPGHQMPRLDGGQIVWNLGSMGNGGLSTLIQLANSINRFLLESSLMGRTDGVAESRSYGLVHLASQMVADMGLTRLALAHDDDRNSGAAAASQILPSLLAALLDDGIPSETPVEQLQRRVYFPGNTAVSPKLIRQLLEELGRDCDPVNDPDSRSPYSDRLWRWATEDTFPKLSPVEEIGLERVARLASYLRVSSERNTGSSWASIAGHLSALHAIRMDMGGRTLILTTRPTATQLSLLIRLQIATPPLVFEEKSLEAESTSVSVNEEVWVPHFEPDWN